VRADRVRRLPLTAARRHRASPAGAATCPRATIARLSTFSGGKTVDSATIGCRN
jgi:hypothetical protein